MRTILLVLALSLSAVFCRAQVSDLYIQTRGSFVAGPQSGFQGEYLNLEAKGRIAEGLTCAIRQKFNAPIKSSDLFSATDKIYLQYNTGNWEFTAGKVVLECGGYEYDALPIDVYIAADYWNNGSGFFNYAVSAARYFGSERVCIQVSRSPFSVETLSGLYGYSLSTRGTCGWFSHIWSVNMFELEKGLFSAQQFLGNRFEFGPVTADIDFIHRFSTGSPTFMKDYSLVANVNVAAASWLNIFAKATHDRNETSVNAFVAPGTKRSLFGGGVEVFPIKGSRDLRFHCLYYHENFSAIMAGMTFTFHILKSKNES